MSKNEVDLSSYLIFIVSIGIIGICILLSLPLYFGFAGAVAFAAVILIRKGHKIRALNSMVLAGIKDCSKLLIIVTLTGATVSIWLSSGIVPTLMYYGFEYIKHINYILACFAVTAVVALVMGTSVGTISTIGIALIGIGKGFEIPIHILLGAIVSGAFFADRISPISGIVNLMIKTVGIKYNDYVKSLLNTLIPSIAIASAIYFFIGRDYMSVINPEKIAVLQNNIINAFEITPEPKTNPAKSPAITPRAASPGSPKSLAAPLNLKAIFSMKPISLTHSMAISTGIMIYIIFKTIE